MLRAYVVQAPGLHGLCEVEVPKPDYGEVLVAPAAVGLCGSDLELLDGRRPAQYVRYPIVPGHEWSGYVVSSGPDVSGLPPGTGVVAEGIRACGHCARCAEGRNNLCVSQYAETGFTHAGALADRVVVPARLVHALPPDRPIAVAALLEPAACVAGGLLELGIPRPGARIAVIGDGPLGLLALSLLRLSTPRELLLVGAQPHRTAFGSQMGATATVLAGEDLADLRGGFDLVVECTDSPSGAALALDLARRAGSVLLAGITGALDPTLRSDAISLGSLRVHGVFGAPRVAWRWLLELYGAGMFDPAALITHRFGLDRTAEAFAVLGRPAAGALKVLVEPCPVPPG